MRMILTATLILAIILLAMLTVPVTGSLNTINNVEKGSLGYAIPSENLASGSSGLLILPSNRASIKVNVTVIVESGGMTSVYTYTKTLYITGLPWPYEWGLYAYVLPGLPAAKEFYTYGETPIMLTVESTVVASYVMAGKLESVSVKWVYNGTRSNPHVIMTVDGGSYWTLYLSPRGWTIEPGRRVRVLAYAYGLGRDPVVSLLIGAGENPAEYIMDKDENWWNSLGYLVNDLNSWLKKLPDEDRRLTGHLPYAQYSGGVWVYELPAYTPGSLLVYEAKARGNNGQAYSMKGWALVTAEGKRVLVIDSTPLLYTVGEVNRGVQPPENSPQSYYQLAYRLGDALWASGLLKEHYYQAISKSYNLYIAFPGKEAAGLLQGGNYSAVLIEPLPPPARGTLLDWSNHIDSMIRGLLIQASRGAGIIASSTSIGDLPGAYNYTLTSDGKILELLGLSTIKILHELGYSPILSPQLSWNGTLYLTDTSYTLPSKTSVIGGVNVPGVLIAYSACSPVLKAEDLTSPWYTLATKDYPGGDWVKDAEYAAETPRFIRAGLKAINDSLYINASLVVNTINNSKYSININKIITDLSTQAVPVMISSDCQAAILARDNYYRSVYFTFDPLVNSKNLNLVLWALDWTTSKPTPLTSIDGIYVTSMLARNAKSIAVVGGKWRASIATPKGTSIEKGNKTLVLVAPWGSLTINSSLSRTRTFYGGEIVLVDSERKVLTVKPEGPLRIQPFIYTESIVKLSKPTRTTKTETGRSTMTTTTTSRSTSATMTTTIISKQEVANTKVLLGILVSAGIIAGIAIVNYRRKKVYKYI